MRNMNSISEELDELYNIITIQNSIIKNLTNALLQYINLEEIEGMHWQLR